MRFYPLRTNPVTYIKIPEKFGVNQVLMFPSHKLEIWVAICRLVNYGWLYNTSIYNRNHYNHSLKDDESGNEDDLQDMYNTKGLTW